MKGLVLVLVFFTGSTARADAGRDQLIALVKHLAKGSTLNQDNKGDVGGSGSRPEVNPEGHDNKTVGEQDYSKALHEMQLLEKRDRQRRILPTWIYPTVFRRDENDKDPAQPKTDPIFKTPGVAPPLDQTNQIPPIPTTRVESYPRLPDEFERLSQLINRDKNENPEVSKLSPYERLQRIIRRESVRPAIEKAFQAKESAPPISEPSPVTPATTVASAPVSSLSNSAVSPRFAAAAAPSRGSEASRATPVFSPALRREESPKFVALPPKPQEEPKRRGLRAIEAGSGPPLAERIEESTAVSVASAQTKGSPAFVEPLPKETAEETVAAKAQVFVPPAVEIEGTNPPKSVPILAATSQPSSSLLPWLLALLDSFDAEPPMASVPVSAKHGPALTSAPPRWASHSASPVFPAGLAQSSRRPFPRSPNDLESLRSAPSKRTTLRSPRRRERRSCI